MAPSILIAGATGNTGRNVVQTLSKQLDTNKAIAGHRILALTRSAKGPAAQQLAKLPGVEVIEKSWVEITADWLREHQVDRAFIASHNEPNQFAEESTFHLAALRAGVKYVVRISTTAANVTPDCEAYYPRNHWAVEALLSSPEFKALQWTSLQPNVFTPLVLYPAAELIKKYRETGKQGPLSLLWPADAPVAAIDPDDVGAFAATLLCEEDPSIHNNARYVLNGPEDMTANQIVEMTEQRIGVKVEDVRFADMSFVDDMAAARSHETPNIILSIKHALDTARDGKCTASTTSPEVFKICAPKRTPEEVFKTLLGE